VAAVVAMGIVLAAQRWLSWLRLATAAPAAEAWRQRRRRRPAWQQRWQNVKRYLINHLISTMLSGQCFVFLFCRLTEQPHQVDDMNNPTSMSRC
jgi:hypothetical protein